MADWSWELIMTARHAIWLHQCMPCDVEAFTEGADALLGPRPQGRKLDGHSLFQLTVIAVMKWPVAIKIFVREVLARQDPLDIDWDAYRAIFWVVGILGAHYEEQHILPNDAQMRKRFHLGFARELEVVSMIIDFFAWHTNNMQREVGVNALHHWVDRIIDVEKSCSRPRPIVDEDRTTRPRDKTLGHLFQLH